jgi:hypothetical protein
LKKTLEEKKSELPISKKSTWKNLQTMAIITEKRGKTGKRSQFPFPKHVRPK